MLFYVTFSKNKMYNKNFIASNIVIKKYSRFKILIKNINDSTLTNCLRKGIFALIAEGRGTVCRGRVRAQCRADAVRVCGPLHAYLH